MLSLVEPPGQIGLSPGHATKNLLGCGFGGERGERYRKPALCFGGPWTSMIESPISAIPCPSSTGVCACSPANSREAIASVWRTCPNWNSSCIFDRTLGIPIANNGNGGARCGRCINSLFRRLTMYPIWCANSDILQGALHHIGWGGVWTARIHRPSSIIF